MSTSKLFIDCPDPWRYKSERFNWPLIILNGVLAGVIFWGIDILFYGPIAPDLISYPGMRATPGMTHLAIGYGTAGLLFSCVYAFWWCPIPFPWWKKGCYFGPLLACVIFLPTAFFNHALFEDWSLTTGLIQTVYQSVQFALVGMIIGWSFHKFRNDSLLDRPSLSPKDPETQDR